MLIIPYEVDVPFDRTPFANWLLIASVVVVFLLQMGTALEVAPMQNAGFDMEEYVLDGFSIKGLFGHMWLHNGIIHVAGNLLFLWVFGNAVCQKVGNLLYLPVYLIVGICAALLHLVCDGMPAVGASGAINGIVGIYLIFFTRHDISCFWYFFFRAGTFSVSGYWMILMWLAFDIIGIIQGGGGVGYFAHIGGFAAGVGIAFALLLTKIVVMDERFDESLLQIFKNRDKEEPLHSQTDFEIRQMLDRKKYGELEKTSSEPASPQYIEPEDILAVEKTDHRQVEISEGIIRFFCECGQKIKMPIIYAGKKGKCPKCKERITIPS